MLVLDCETLKRLPLSVLSYDKAHSAISEAHSSDNRSDDSRSDVAAAVFQAATLQADEPVGPSKIATKRRDREEDTQEDGAERQTRRRRGDNSTDANGAPGRGRIMHSIDF